MLDYAPHRGVRDVVRDLNALYRSRPALHARDCELEGFSWLIVDDKKNSVFAWLRTAPGADPVAVICNFTPVPREDYRVPLPHAGRWQEIINTDAADYGGSGVGNGGFVEAREGNGKVVATMLLPPLATVMLEFVV
jgi:1,4-alpha-glucan branching enzyme